MKKGSKKKADEDESSTSQKKAQSAINGTPATPTDARVAQQIRVLEVVGAGGKSGKDEGKYSPRTEAYIKQLTDVLDFFAYSRQDIANLVRRCHHDEQQIQIAVENIIEDKANHEQDSWGVVRTKKQQKEERKIKEEEEKHEKDRIEKELEKKRRDAEKRERAAWHAGHKYAGSESFKENSHHSTSGDAVIETAVGTSTALPPDPAILFACPLPAEGRETMPEENNSDEWWEDSRGGGNYWDESKSTWDWKQGQGKWDDSTWGNSKDGTHETHQDGWWSSDWDKAGVNNSETNAAQTQAPRAKRGQKEKHSAPKKETTEMWDMPDTAAPASEGGLDQWALGDIRAHERRVAGGEAPEPETHAQAPLEPAMLTVEELERSVGASGSGRGADAGKNRIEMLLEASDLATAAPVAPVAPVAPGAGAANEKPERGRGRGGKGGGKTERPPRGERVEKAEERADKERLERLDRSEDPRRQPMEEVGENVTVKKHSSMGCAVVSLKDPRVREAILALLQTCSDVTINGIKVQVKPHTEKDTKAEIPTDLFVAWGHKVEKNTPLSEHELTKFFDTKHQEVSHKWAMEMQEKARVAEERARQQKLLEEQQKQQAEQREREEQRRIFEEEMRRRSEEELQQRQVEAQRKHAEEQRRQEEARRIHRETQAKWINDFSWAHGGPQHAAAVAAAAAAAGAAAQPRSAASGTAGALTAATVSPASAGVAATGATVAATGQTQADQATVSGAVGASLTPAATAAYPSQAAAQWGAAQAQQWMQGMACHSQQQGWQQQMMAQRGMQQQQMAQGALAAQGTPGAVTNPQDYESLRAHAAYYAYIAEQQQRGGQNVAAYAAPQQGGYLNAGQHNPAFNYGAAASFSRNGLRST